MVNDSIAGFDFSLIEGILRSDFKYEGNIDDLRRDEDSRIVRLHDNAGLDVSIVKKDYFRFKSMIVHYYVRNRNERQVIELTDRERQLSIVGYSREDKHG